MPPPQLTLAVAVILRIFLDDIGTSRYGYELMRITGFRSGKLYPILARLETAGWLQREREDIDPSVARRPIRYIYRLTPSGAQVARLELARLDQQLGGSALRRFRPSANGGNA